LIIIIYLKSGNGKLLCVPRFHDIISYPKSNGFLCLVKNFCYYVNTFGYGLCNYAKFHAFLVFVFPTILLSTHFILSYYGSFKLFYQMTNIFFLCGIVVVFISISFEQFFSFLCVYCDCKKKYFYFGL